ncbi:DMT family transporter [Hafnia paralvei]|uniref:DMT family transporter n=1 Tax=Hafnia paralvei TaxID=546367 RepID=UPI0024E11A48|nr:multidrug efflux SMR transporter [Hafnia paralvei]
MSPVFITYGALAFAIVCEVIATSILPHTKEFTRPGLTLVMALLYATAFYMLSIATRTMPIGIAYAIWSCLGIVLIAGANYVLFKQTLDFPAMLRLVFIIAGVLIINLFSRSVSH